jgi:hypothetical protein
MLRKMALRELEGDVRTATNKLHIGGKLLYTAPTEEDKQKVQAHMADLMRFRVISELTLEHLRKVHKDPRRTGEAKERIFVRLGAEPNTPDTAPGIGVLPKGVSASRPI